MRTVTGLFAGTVALAVLATVGAMIAEAPEHGVNQEIAAHVYRLLDMMLAGIFGAAAGHAHGKSGRCACQEGQR